MGPDPPRGNDEPNGTGVFPAYGPGLTMGEDEEAGKMTGPGPKAEGGVGTAAKLGNAPAPPPGCDA